MIRDVFQAHIELLQFFLARRAQIVERIEGLLNARRKPVEYLQDGPLLSRHIEDGFFIGATEGQSHLRGQLEAAHWGSGFKPRHLPGLHNGLIDPAEMMIRGFHAWRQTRWPGRNGRVRYAHTLFNLYVLRQLELLSMRVWDPGPGSAGERLSYVQGVLDQLWTTAPADQPVLLRDARWLIPMAQSPATDDLGAYFRVAESVSTSLPAEDRIEIHKAGVRMAAGHLRSQIRYHSTTKGVSLNHAGVVLSTRTSNALDFALLIQELVPLLETYEHACQGGDGRRRLELADAICQGISPDPELFVNRVALLGAYSMIEHLFIATGGDGQVAYTPMGGRHVRLFQEFEGRIGRVAKQLSDDGPNFRPAAGACSPYGVLYGFSTDLIEHMALKTLQPDAVTRFGLEDVFTAGDAGSGKLEWVNGWRKLPHITRDVEKLFDYPQEFAEDVFERMELALRRRVSGDEGNAAVPTGRLFILSGDDAEMKDVHRAEAYDERQLLTDRREGQCLVSYQTSGGWVALSKAILTEVLGAGRDAAIAGLPRGAAETLKLMYPNLVAWPGHPQHRGGARM